MDEDAFLNSSIELYLARQNQQLMKDGKNITNYKTSETLDYKEVSGEEESFLEKSVQQYLTRQNNQLLEKYRNTVHSEISQIINKEECSNELESDMFEKIMDGDVNDKENDEVLVNEVKESASDDQKSSGNEMNHETNMNNNLSTRDVDNSTETQSSEHENNFVDTVMDESEINCPEDVNHIDFSVDTKTDYQIEDENIISDEAESNSSESNEFSDEDLSTDYEEYDDIYENVPLPNDITLKESSSQWDDYETFEVINNNNN